MSKEIPQLLRCLDLEASHCLHANKPQSMTRKEAKKQWSTKATSQPSDHHQSLIYSYIINLLLWLLSVCPLIILRIKRKDGFEYHLKFLSILIRILRKLTLIRTSVHNFFWKTDRKCPLSRHPFLFLHLLFSVQCNLF